MEPNSNNINNQTNTSIDNSNSTTNSNNNNNNNIDRSFSDIRSYWHSKIIPQKPDDLTTSLAPYRKGGPRFILKDSTVPVKPPPPTDYPSAFYSTVYSSNSNSNSNTTSPSSSSSSSSNNNNNINLLATPQTPTTTSIPTFLTSPPQQQQQQQPQVQQDSTTNNKSFYIPSSAESLDNHNNTTQHSFYHPSSSSSVSSSIAPSASSTTYTMSYNHTFSDVYSTTSPTSSSYIGGNVHNIAASDEYFGDNIYTVNNKYTASNSYGAYSSGSSNSSYDANQVNYQNENRTQDLGYYDDYDEQHLFNVSALGDSTNESEYINRNWNDIFQTLLDLPCSEKKYKSLSNIASDFVYCADTFGKIIISELHLPIESKSIKPLDLGGVGGGLKYIVSDIIFKFVVDTELLPGLWMYGHVKRSDEKAQKSASLEIKGINFLMENASELLRFPLMAIIDYRGYRLLAIARLPINKNTIVYGSHDGGATVHDKDPEVSKEMERIAKILNLRGHKVGRQGVHLYGPGDIEIHKGSDGRYYMIDFARLFAPEFSPIFNGKKEVGREIFYAMLRPELVAKSPKPLSSDAFSGWQTNDPEDESINQDVIAISEHLHKVIIPETIAIIDTSLKVDEAIEQDAFKVPDDGGWNSKPLGKDERVTLDDEELANSTASLDIGSEWTDTNQQERGQNTVPTQKTSSSSSTSTSSQTHEIEFVINSLGYTKNSPERDYRQRSNEIIKLINFIHSRGINLRYLGVICRGLTNRNVRNLFMTEVVARCWKRIIRSRCRLKMDSCKMVSEGPYKQIVADCFNVILNTNRTKNRDFWTLNKPGYFKYIAVRLFPRCLSDSDRMPEVDIRSLIDCRLLVLRIIQILNIRINSEAYKQFLSNPNYIITFNDIEEVASTVKYLGIVDYTIGTGMMYETARINNSSRVPPLEVNRWLDQAQAKLQAALRSMPKNLRNIARLATSYLLRANVSSGYLDAIEQLKTALRLLRQSGGNDHDIMGLRGMTHVKLATFYLFYAHSGSKFIKELREASNSLEQSLKLNPLALSEVVVQSLPIYTVNNACNAYIGKPARSLYNDTRRINELFSMVYLYEKVISPLDHPTLYAYLPKVFAQVNQIVYFTLPHALSGIINSSFAPSILNGITNIDLLSLNDMVITPTIARSILSLKRLETFKLQNVKFLDGEQGETAAAAEQVSTFNQFFGKLLAEGHGITSLHLVDSPSINDKAFDGIYEGFNGVKEIEFNGTSLTDATLVAMAPYAKKLEIISLVGTTFSDEGVATLLEAPRQITQLIINTLDKKKSNIGEKTAKAIAKSSLGMRQIQLNHVNFSAEEISDIIKSAQGIEKIDLSHTNSNLLTMEGLEYHGAEHLTHLNLHDTGDIANVEDFVEMLCNIQPRLKSLKLPRFVSEPFNNTCGLIQLVRRLTDLEDIQFPAGFNVIDFVRQLGEKSERGDFERPLHELRSLDVSESFFDKDSLQTLIDLSPNLTNLALAGGNFCDSNGNIIIPDDTLLIQFGLLLFNLHELDFSRNQFERRNVVCLLSRCPSVRTMHLKDNPLITPTTIQELRKDYPHILFNH
ncbi:hypothetical protein DFA_11632 [Cavenderia fasciculata]|uniref:Clu domain-containing protein n=1 Tax=Cavenderia fasciculata TaxID=261658 RepID=F4QDS4_CACFS|nr:uncharacterized protein DFA_11632 [Cavenderia fasciculata]EGG13871.1 hypothetical protein DFA_11632 [Cavenderia fasciculata]|eukprot:XP_004350579.1 hypothetical protein DFA_11632 [Cavenderia fasciculata]